MNYERNYRIDIIKGIAITLMVVGHTGVRFKSFIYLFHMAIFFMVSGYLYNYYYFDSPKSIINFIKKKILTLWLPFFLGNTVYSLLHNFFIFINVYTDDELFLTYCKGTYYQVTQYWTIGDILKNILKSAFFAGDTQLGGGFWFLKVLFVLSIMYAIIDFVLAKWCNNWGKMIQTIISIVLLAVGYCLSVKNVNFFSAQIVFSCYCLFHMGVMLKGVTEKYIYGLWEHLIILIGAFGVLCVLNNLGEISLGNNFYPNPLFLLIASLVGWILLSEAAYFLEKCEMAKRMFVCLGRSTLPILIMHFLCFKIVSYIGVIYENKPFCLVAAFPVLYSDKLWWCAYTIVGLVIPILCTMIIKFCLRKFVS